MSSAHGKRTGRLTMIVTLDRKSDAWIRHISPWMIQKRCCSHWRSERVDAHVLGDRGRIDIERLLDIDARVEAHLLGHHRSIFRAQDCRYGPEARSVRKSGRAAMDQERTYHAEAHCEAVRPGSSSPGVCLNVIKMKRQKRHRRPKAKAAPSTDGAGRSSSLRGPRPR